MHSPSRSQFLIGFRHAWFPKMGEFRAEERTFDGFHVGLLRRHEDDFLVLVELGHGVAMRAHLLIILHHVILQFQLNRRFRL